MDAVVVSENYVLSPFCVDQEIPYLHERQYNKELVLIPLQVSPMQGWGSLGWMRALQLVDISAAEDMAAAMWQFVSGLETILRAPPRRSIRNTPPEVDLHGLSVEGYSIGREGAMCWFSLATEAWASQRWSGGGSTISNQTGSLELSA